MAEIEWLELEPSTLTLTDARDGRQVLVWGVTRRPASSTSRRLATFKSDSPALSIVDGDYVYGPPAGLRGVGDRDGRGARRRSCR